MKASDIKKDKLILLTTCLAAGGIGMAVIFCFLIGFGLNTMVGKEALYAAAVLLILNLWAIRHREKEWKPERSAALRRGRTLCNRLWQLGIALLLLALIFGIFGVRFGDLRVKLPCLLGTIFLPLGWLGALLIFRYETKKQEPVPAKESYK